MTQQRLGDFGDADVPPSDRFDPLAATFRGGKQEPFHEWYGYLEGYSPEFVRTVLDQYMTEADSVLDPFGGTVTTGFTAAERGLDSYYCEVNPVLQTVTDCKATVRTLSSDDREQVASTLRDIASTLAQRIADAPPDQSLLRSYRHAFRGSQFFNPDVLDAVVSARSVVDELRDETQVIGELVSVAVLSSLVTCSRLKRGGDLQFIDEDKWDDTPTLHSEVSEKLREMATDLSHTDAEIDKKPEFLCANAAAVDTVPHREVDAVITSPPYINGTNYFRNTKLELWFLGELEEEGDLRDYRDRALTAGINTVDGTYATPDVDLVREVVADLEEHGYDSRLPRMVAGYCAELQTVFESLQSQLAPGATIAVDIGDSIYAGVHVPADQMIIQLLEQIGYTHAETVKLRDRQSNDGADLKQVLLVFTYKV